MLFLAEGTINSPVVAEQITAAQAWLGPMVDGGFLHSGYLDAAGGRMWLVLSSDARADAVRRINDMPLVREGVITFTTTPVTAVRFR